MIHEDPSRLSSIVIFTPSDILIQRYCASMTARVLTIREWSRSLVLESHHGVECVRFSPDGHYIVSGGRNGTLQTWDAASGASLKAMRIGGNRVPVTSLSCVAQQNEWLVVSGYDDGTIHVWNALSGTVIRTMQADNTVDAVAYLPDGKRLLSVNRDSSRLDLWDSSTGSRVKSISLQLEDRSYLSIRKPVFSADGAMVFTAYWGTSLRIWDTCSGAVLQKLSGHSSGVVDAVFTVDGKRVISSGEDSTVRAWSVGTGELLRTMEGHSEWSMTAVAVSAIHIASADWHKVVFIWSVDSYDLLTTISPHHPTWINSLNFSPDGTQLASGSKDDIVRVWAPSVTAPHAHIAKVICVVFSADGELIATRSRDSTIIIWEARTGKLVRKLEGHTSHVKTVAFSPDRQRLVSVGDGRLVRVWNIKTGELMQSLSGHTKAIWTLALSRDGEMAATGSKDKTIRLWEMTAGNLEHIRTLKARFYISTLAFSPDRQRLVSGGSGGISVWDVETGGLIQALHSFERRVEYVTWSPNGEWILGSLDRDAREVLIWSAVDWQPVSTRRSDWTSKSIHSEDESPEEESAAKEMYRWDGLDAEIFCDESAREWIAPHATFQVQDDGWVIYRRSNKKICWLPPLKRPYNSSTVASYGRFCAIGAESGQVTILNVSEVIDSSSSTTSES